MKFAAMIEYSSDREAAKSNGPAHHDYMRSLLDDGRLFAAGPLADHLGALWIFEAETLDGAEELIRTDPYNAAGVFLNWKIRPLSSWSAKEHKGA